MTASTRFGRAAAAVGLGGILLGYLLTFRTDVLRELRAATRPWNGGRIAAERPPLEAAVQLYAPLQDWRPRP